MPTTISEVLVQYQRNCRALEGAVVATHDGLVLGATESFSGDAPAAAAASLSVHLPQDLSIIQTSDLREALFWASNGVWYWSRLVNNHLLLAHSLDLEQAGALRLAGKVASQQLSLMI